MVCVVGSGWRFTSGISYYTCRFANTLADYHQVSVIQIRQLLPRCSYPGRQRVGQARTRMKSGDEVEVYDGVDWWWGYSLIGALFRIHGESNLSVISDGLRVPKTTLAERRRYRRLARLKCTAISDRQGSDPSRLAWKLVRTMRCPGPAPSQTCLSQRLAEAKPGWRHLGADYRCRPIEAWLALIEAWLGLTEMLSSY